MSAEIESKQLLAAKPNHSETGVALQTPVKGSCGIDATVAKFETTARR
jgi:hypothetical protein